MAVLFALIFVPFLHMVQAANGPFLTSLSSNQWMIGNDIWNMTQGPQYGTKLFYKGHDCVGNAVGHYVSYNGAANDLRWTSAEVYHEGPNYIDVRFTAAEGDMHWVIFNDLAGAYQYFVNRALPVLGEFRTLWRLDNETFPNGRTNIKDGPLPEFSEYGQATKVQDETWQRADGTYITKYDWTAFIRDQDFYGLYGDGFGSWYINPGKDYYNGNHLKQELMVHRESGTGDAVMLNMIHGTHFQAVSSDALPEGKMWGPWLWYLNDGSKADADDRHHREFATWPYSWFEDAAYHSRGSVKGTLKLSDGRPAAGAAVFLGDNNPTKTALDMGQYYYYTAYADEKGRFSFDDVRSGTYGLQAWSNGGAIRDVATSFLRNDVSASSNQNTDLGELNWEVPPGRERIFQVGDFDRKSLGFKYGGAPYQHALVANCPTNLTFTVGESADSDWCFGQTWRGTWSVRFNLAALPADSSRKAILTVSLASYSSGSTSSIYVNGATKVGNLTSGAILSDPGLYRSATTAGEWHLYEFTFDGGRMFKQGWNTVDLVQERSTTWHGFMWDSIILEWS